MSNYLLFPLQSLPGIQRDGTNLDSESYIDGQWVRFYKGKPRKIGGYKTLLKGNNVIIRSILGIARTNNNVNFYLGKYNSFSYINVSNTGTVSPPVDRTPATLTSDQNNVWYMSTMSVSTGVSTFKTQIIAASIPNAEDLASTNPGQIFIGDVDSTSPLVASTEPTAIPSGGIVVVPPFLFWFGNDGLVYRTAADDPQTLASTDGVTAVSDTKIVAGFPTGAGATVPAVLFWSMNSLIRGVYDPVNDAFSYATLESNISILSARSIVQFEQNYFWIGKKQFYVFNGVVKRLENEMNANWFFENINQQHQSKVWGYVNREFHEIWWFYPRGTNTECSHYIKYNIKLNTWDDGELSRAHGVPADVYDYPVLSSSSLEQDQARRLSYPLWQHETGYDKVLFGEPQPIRSWFETRIINMGEGNPSNNRQFRTRRTEPDFSMSGSMNVIINKREFAQGPITSSETKYLDPTTPHIDFNEMGRMCSYRFESNDLGGFYQMGRVFIDIEMGDERP